MLDSLHALFTHAYLGLFVAYGLVLTRVAGTLTLLLFGLYAFTLLYAPVCMYTIHRRYYYTIANDNGHYLIFYLVGRVSKTTHQAVRLPAIEAVAVVSSLEARHDRSSGAGPPTGGNLACTGFRVGFRRTCHKTGRSHRKLCREPTPQPNRRRIYRTRSRAED